MLRHGCRKLATLCLGATLLVGQGPVGTAGAQTGTAPTFVLKWSAGPFTQDKGNPIAESSPTVATLDATGPAVVVADRSGYVYAYHLADGSAVTGWPVYDGGAAIDSTPSVAPLGGSSLDSVFVGAGDAQAPAVGAYLAYGPGGQALWRTNVSDPVGDPHPAYAVPGVAHRRRPARQHGRLRRFLGPVLLRPRRLIGVGPARVAVLQCRQHLFHRRHRRPLRGRAAGTGGGRGLFGGPGHGPGLLIGAATSG